MLESKKINSQAPLLVIAWDGAEWEIINSLLASGDMPHLQSFLENGKAANIASLQPMLSPLLWTSVVTGKRAHEHGILGFVESGLQGLRPISNINRKVPAIWNILSAAGLSCQVLNWWPSNPVEETAASFVSNLAFADNLIPGQVSPEKWRKKLDEIRSNHADLNEEVLMGFFPNHLPGNLKNDPIVKQVAGILKRGLWQFETAMQMLEENADCRLFYFEALDQLQHIGSAYYPPKQSHIPEKDFQAYRHIIRLAYKWHDAMLGSFMKRASNHNLILLSDHGFELGAARQKELPDIPAAPATEHKAFGFFAAAGPDVDLDSHLQGLSLLDITPSLLHYFNLPLASDMKGRIKPIFKRVQPPSWIPTWNTLYRPNFTTDFQHEGSLNLLRDLEALDYVDLSALSHRDQIIEEQDYNAAVSLKEAGEFRPALDLADQYYAKSLKAFRWYILKARLHLSLNDIDGFSSFWSSLNESQSLAPQLRFLRVIYYLQAGKVDTAITEFKALEAQELVTVSTYNEMAHALLLADQINSAQEFFQKALGRNSNSSSALNGLAQIAFAKGDYEGFQERANQALALKSHQPQLHFLWASYYHLIGEVEACKKALQVCLDQAPQHQKALHLRSEMNGSLKGDTSFIVSGFPRSGTSLMMAILQEAGIPILTDNQRAEDEHNPRGYFEWEGVKQLPSGGGIEDTQNRATKVIAPFLPYLPNDRKYKVIWMERPTIEIILSQSKMKGDKTDLENFPFQKGQQLDAEKERYKRWLHQQVHFEFLEVSYHNLLGGDAEIEMNRINEFLGINMDKADLSRVVDPELHRNKIG